MLSVFDRIMHPDFSARYLTVVALHVLTEAEAERKKAGSFEQMDLFTDYEAKEREKKRAEAALRKEKAAQKAVLGIRERFGKNAVLRGADLQEGANAEERNSQIGGHRG